MTEVHELPDAAVVVVAAGAVEVVVTAGAEVVVVVLWLDPDPDPEVVPDDVLEPPGLDEQAAQTRPALSTRTQTNGRRISP